MLLWWCPSRGRLLTSADSPCSIESGGSLAEKCLRSLCLSSAIYAYKKIIFWLAISYLIQNISYYLNSTLLILSPLFSAKIYILDSQHQTYLKNKGSLWLHHAADNSPQGKSSHISFSDFMSMYPGIRSETLGLRKELMKNYIWRDSVWVFKMFEYINKMISCKFFEYTYDKDSADRGLHEIPCERR